MSDGVTNAGKQFKGLPNSLVNKVPGRSSQSKVNNSGKGGIERNLCTFDFSLIAHHRYTIMTGLEPSGFGKITEVRAQ